MCHIQIPIRRLRPTVLGYGTLAVNQINQCSSHLCSNSISSNQIRFLCFHHLIRHRIYLRCHNLPGRSYCCMLLAPPVYRYYALIAGALYGAICVFKSFNVVSNEWSSSDDTSVTVLVSMKWPHLRLSRASMASLTTQTSILQSKVSI